MISLVYLLLLNIVVLVHATGPANDFQLVGRGLAESLSAQARRMRQHSGGGMNIPKFITTWGTKTCQDACPGMSDYHGDLLVWLLTNRELISGPDADLGQMLGQVATMSRPSLDIIKCAHQKPECNPQDKSDGIMFVVGCLIECDVMMEMAMTMMPLLVGMGSSQPANSSNSSNMSQEMQLMQMLCPKIDPAFTCASEHSLCASLTDLGMDVDSSARACNVWQSGCMEIDQTCAPEGMMDQCEALALGGALKGSEQQTLCCNKLSEMATCLHAGTTNCLDVFIAAGINLTLSMEGFRAACPMVMLPTDCKLGTFIGNPLFNKSLKEEDCPVPSTPAPTTTAPPQVVDIAWTAGFGDESARQKTVGAGNKLIFTWSGTHNVYKMPDKAAFIDCDFSNATNLGDTSPVEYTMGSTTEYFACKVSTHCSSGQKLAAEVAQAKATCDSYTSCSAPTPVNKGSTVECSGNTASCDAGTCCEAKATCDSYTSCSAPTPMNKGSTVECSGNTASCDAGSCCEAKATCDSYTSCAAPTPVNKGSGVECSGNTTSCDAGTCCEAKAKCDSYTSCAAPTPVNKGSDVECSGNTASCDAGTCCEAKATCDSYTSCAAPTPVNKGSGVECSGNAGTCDAGSCCEAKATCDSYTSCSAPTPVNKGSTVECSGNTGSCDADTCCEAAANPAPTPPAGNPTPAPAVITAVSDPVSVGDTTVKLKDVSGLAVGDYLTFSDGTNSEVNKIAHIAPDRRLARDKDSSDNRRLATSGTVTVDTPMQFAYSADASVTATKSFPTTTTPTPSPTPQPVPQPPSQARDEVENTVDLAELASGKFPAFLLLLFCIVLPLGGSV